MFYESLRSFRVCRFVFVALLVYHTHVFFDGCLPLMIDLRELVESVFCHGCRPRSTGAIIAEPPPFVNAFPASKKPRLKAPALSKSHAALPRESGMALSIYPPRGGRPPGAFPPRRLPFGSPHKAPTPALPRPCRPFRHTGPRYRANEENLPPPRIPRSGLRR